LKLKQILLNLVLPVVVLFGAVLVIRHLAATRPETKSMKPPDMGQFVTVEVAKPYAEPTHVKAVGRVKPAREVVLSPEVSGRITTVHPNLIPGGFIKADEVAFEIDDRPYKLAVAQQQANVARARVDLQIEGGRKVVAEREWSLLESEIESSATGKSLALREPQKRLAEVSVAAAGSALDRARLDVERTTIKVPFNAMVKTESVELGLLATPQAPLVSLVGTDTFWVEVTLPIGDVTRLAIPGINGVAEGQGAQATILQKNAAVTRRGRVIKLLSELDPLGAQARIIVEVEDPLGLSGENRGLPLFLGSFVDVELDGTAFDSVVAIPRKALRDGDFIWVLSADGKLEIRDITVVWRERELVLATAGVAPGDKVITSRLSAPVAGMPLKVAGAAATAQGGPPGVAPPGAVPSGAPPAAAPKPVPQAVQP
jgi:RND family efflux transporter MFP subunit